MDQSQYQPLYTAKDRVPFNLTLVLAVGITIWGLAGYLGFGFSPQRPDLIIILGLAITAYTWLFTPREYFVYNDAVCVAYGRPRVKTIHFSNIASVEMGSLATIDQLRIRPVRGRRQSIRVRDPEAFYDQLEAALNAYRATHPDEDIYYQFTGRHPSEVSPEAPAVVIEGAPVEMVDVDAEAQSAAWQAEDIVPEDSVPGDGQATPGSPADPLVNPPVAEVSDTPETEEPAGEAPPEDRENPQEPGSRSFY